MSTDQDRTKRVREYSPDDTPNSVIGAVVAGSVVVPFLIVLGFLFIVHGIFVNVDQPDVTDSRQGEAAVGLAIVVMLGFVLFGLNRMLSGRDRWVFLAGQALTFGISLDFVIDRSSGDPLVPAIVMLASLAAIALVFAPDSRGWIRTHGGTEPVTSGPPA